ncbi:hypothetical protein DRQ11_13030 [candidate division KSB1 bacterium]|nr:MAG: hypothetical protein DRQ11_13030 [candidate division KSB1 bacterium]
MYSEGAAEPCWKEAIRRISISWRRGRARGGKRSEGMASGSTEFRKKVIFLVTAYVVVVSLLAFILIPLYMPYTLAAWFIVALGGVFALVRWLAHNTVYVCPNCGHRFTISAFRYAISPHMWEKKLLRCPKCGKREWCRVLYAGKISSER